MKKTLIIPLDSRPCNTAWLERLAAEAGVPALIYPRSRCGALHRGADFAGMMSMIEANIADCEYLLISADGLASGGLIQARLGLADPDRLSAELKVLGEYKKRYPELKIYVFDTLMRTSITAYDAESARHWSLVNEYSRLSGEEGAEESARLRYLEKTIPESVLNRYLRAREIKLRLNLYFLEQTAAGVVDYLIILQEDTAPRGIQKREQEIIADFIKEHGLGNKVKTHNGTDEGGLLLLAKIVNEKRRHSPRVYLLLPEQGVLEKTMLFEDRPFGENLRAMFETAGFVPANDPDSADFILAVYAEKENKDLDLSDFREVLPEKGPRYRAFVRELNNYLAAGKPAGLVDLLFPNGGSPELLGEIDYRALKVYSAWNTASNALGSALCEIAVLTSVPDADHEAFKNERIMDDCVYQYIVRRQVNRDLLASGHNIYDLGDLGPKVAARIAGEMEKYRFLVDNRRFRISLPWNRTFEIDIEVED